MGKKIEGVSRRDFLSTAVKAGTVGALATGAIMTACGSEKGAAELNLPPLLDQAPDGKKLKAGLVGCGNRGTGAVLNFLDCWPQP